MKAVILEKLVGFAVVPVLLATVACAAEKPPAEPTAKWEQPTLVAAAAPSASAKSVSTADSGAAPAEGDVDPDIPDGPAKELGKQEISVLVDALPLSRDAIRFQALDKFILLYAPFTANKAQLRLARVRFRNARSAFAVDSPTLATSTNARQFEDILKTPTDQYYPGLLANVLSGLSLTRAIIADFYEQVRGRNALTKEQEAKVLAQIGSGPGSSSIYDDNYYVFQDLKRRYQGGR